MALRIAFIDSWWHGAAHGSGTAVGIDGLADGLSSLGHRVTRLSPKNGGGHLTARLLYNLHVPRLLPAGAYDLVVGFDWDGFLYRPKNGCPYVVGLKGIAADELRHESGWSRWMMRGQACLEKVNTRHASKVVTTSCYSRRVGIAAYGLAEAKVSTVPEGIHGRHWRHEELPTDETGAKTSGDSVILTVARQYPRKNTATLLAAMAKLTDKLSAAKLRVVGDGPELASLMAQSRRLDLGDRVTFLGTVTDAELQREYRHADLFCLPSRQEGFGIAFLEAMAAGLPVVAANAGAVPELVQDQHTGLLVDPNDPNALAAALAELLGNPVRRAQMGQAAKQRAKQYHWPQVAARFLAATGLGDNGHHEPVTAHA